MWFILLYANQMNEIPLYMHTCILKIVFMPPVHGIMPFLLSNLMYLIAEEAPNSIIENREKNIRCGQHFFSSSTSWGYSISNVFSIQCLSIQHLAQENCYEKIYRNSVAINVSYRYGKCLFHLQAVTCMYVYVAFIISVLMLQMFAFLNVLCHLYHTCQDLIILTKQNN